MGPADFLGLEDNEALKFVQEGLRNPSTNNNVVKLDAGPRGHGHAISSPSPASAPSPVLPGRDGHPCRGEAV